MHLINYYSKKFIFDNKNNFEKKYKKKKLTKADQKQNIKIFTKKKLLPKILLNKNLVIREHISYIISVSFSRSNTFLTISKSNGNLCLSYNAGDLGFSGKQKKIRKSIIIKLLKLFINKYHLKYSKYSIGLHLIRTFRFTKPIIKFLKSFFFIKAIKTFDKNPYNGVRGKKLRRKKYISKSPLR